MNLGGVGESGLGRGGGAVKGNPGESKVLCRHDADKSKRSLVIWGDDKNNDAKASSWRGRGEKQVVLGISSPPFHPLWSQP